MGQRIFASIDFSNVERNGKYIDITAKHVNKAFGVSIFVAQVGANKSYAIGDSYNDISMLKAVDFSFAMQSGTREVKDIADMEVTGIKECLEVIKINKKEDRKMNSTICIGFTLLMLVICLVVKNKKVATIGCGLVSLIISMVTLYNEGIYVDEMNLEGNPLSFIIVIINIVLFVVLVIVNQKKED